MQQYITTQKELVEAIEQIELVRKHVRDQDDKIAQYKEWHEAMLRQFAKRYAQIHELTNQVKELEKCQENFNAVAERARASDRKCAELTLLCNQQETMIQMLEASLKDS
jgi:predicted RNase H-like nuclease (RuvC/YqgF family)